MAVELDRRRLPGLAIRAAGDRRHGARRATARTGRDRRRGDRRRATVSSLILSALTLVFPSHLNPAALRLHLPSRIGVSPRIARVTVSITGFTPIQPWRAYDDLIEEAAKEYRLDPALIRSVMHTESAFNALAVSPAGAQGLMQLMPALAEELGVSDPFDPRQNIMGGARQLRRLLDLHRGNLRLALASYNAGPGAVARYGSIPPYRETRQYVRRVTDLLARARSG